MPTPDDADLRASEAPSREIPETVTPSIVMGTDIANAIVTRAPLSEAQLECAIEHYAALEAMLRRSGPGFTNPRRDAAHMHNKALDLLNELHAKQSARPPEPSRALPA